jgi:hypothetical protein
VVAQRRQTDAAMHATGRRITTAAGERRRSAATTTRSTHRLNACKARANNDLVVDLVVQLMFAVEVVRASSVRREGMVTSQHSMQCVMMH